MLKQLCLSGTSKLPALCEQLDIRRSGDSQLHRVIFQYSSKENKNMPKWSASSYFNVCPITCVCLCACIVKILEQEKDAVSWEHLNRFIIVRETLTESSQGIFTYISIKYNIFCVVLSSHILDWDIETFILIVLKFTALKNKSFQKTVHVSKQPKPTCRFIRYTTGFRVNNVMV